MTNFVHAKIAGMALIVCAGVLSCDRSAPSEHAVASFSLPGAKYEAPLPGGYCLPTGKYVSNAKLAAAVDSTNLTDLTFYRCADMAAGLTPTSWGMIKTPLSMIKTKAPPRSELIDELKTQVDPAAMKQLDDEAARQAGPQAERVFGQDLKIGMNAKAVGSDKFGIYFAGTLALTDESNKTSNLAVAYSITAVNGSVFSMNIYAPFHGARDVLDVLAKVKKTTADFVNANGG